MPFGYLLKRFRNEQGLSQRKLAEIIGRDHSYIERLETRKRKRPSAEIAAKLAVGLDLESHDAWLLVFVAKYGQYLDIGMVEYALEHPTITEEELSWAMAIRFRWPESLDYPTLFGCARLVARVVEDFLSPKNQLSA